MPTTFQNKHSKLIYKTTAQTMLLTHAEPQVPARQYCCHFSLQLTGTLIVTSNVFLFLLCSQKLLLQYKLIAHLG